MLCALDWLKSFGHQEIHLVGLGWGGLPATFAALLEDAVVQVTLKHALTSYQEVAESENYAWPLSSFVPSVLEKFDLPDCYQALKGKKLRQIEPSEPSGAAKRYPGGGHRPATDEIGASSSVTVQKGSRPAARLPLRASGTSTTRSNGWRKTQDTPECDAP